MFASLKRHFRLCMARDATEAEKALINWDIDYRKIDDGFGTISVRGDIKIPRLGLTKLPDLSKVVLSGDFDCTGNLLTTLEGSPHHVGGHFLCSQNMLTTLKGCATTIRGAFFCSDNRLTSLEHGPERVGAEFGYVCIGNRLTSLEHAPQRFHFLQTDFGVFREPEAIPRGLLGQSAESCPAQPASDGSTSLQENIVVRRPLRLRPA